MTRGSVFFVSNGKTWSASIAYTKPMLWIQPGVNSNLLLLKADLFYDNPLDGTHLLVTENFMI